MPLKKKKKTTWEFIVCFIFSFFMYLSGCFFVTYILGSRYREVVSFPGLSEQATTKFLSVRLFDQIRSQILL